MIIISPNFLKKYDVALSFAEENRASVELVTQLLKEQGIKIFYDDDLRIDSWGKELKHYLDKAYRWQAKYCVVFVSKDYERKRWTQFEVDRARARSFFEKNNAYVLPYLMDDSSYTEVFKEVGCLTHRTHDEYQLAAAIKAKLDRRPERKFLFWFKDLYRKKTRFAAAVTLFIGSAGLFLKDNLTPVNALAEQFYNSSTHHIKGAICKDGWLSTSHGRGTCSKHGGVLFYTDTVLHEKTMEQCKQEAEKESWLDP